MLGILECEGSVPIQNCPPDFECITDIGSDPECDCFPSQTPANPVSLPDGAGTTLQVIIVNVRNPVTSYTPTGQYLTPNNMTTVLQPSYSFSSIVSDNLDSATIAVSFDNFDPGTISSVVSSSGTAHRVGFGDPDTQTFTCDNNGDGYSQEQGLVYVSNYLGNVTYINEFPHSLQAVLSVPVPQIGRAHV